MLEVQDVDVFYGPVQALRGLSLRVDEGEIVALLGANGAGKTTTLRTISGLLAPARGGIMVGGVDVAGMPAHKVVRLGVAHMPEGRELFPELSVLENLRLGYWPTRQDRPGEVRLMEQVMHLFPRLRERSGQASGTLSGGEQQMLTAARALMSRPKLLLVDELSLGLAPIIVQQLFEALVEVNRLGTSVLLVEQFVHLALRYSSRAYVMARGEIVLEGASRDLVARREVMAAYLGESGPEVSDAAPSRTLADANGNGGTSPGRR